MSNPNNKTLWRIRFYILPLVLSVFFFTHKSTASDFLERIYGNSCASKTDRQPFEDISDYALTQIVGFGCGVANPLGGVDCATKIGHICGGTPVSAYGPCLLPQIFYTITKNDTCDPGITPCTLVLEDYCYQKNYSPCAATFNPPTGQYFCAPTGATLTQHGQYNHAYSY